ncbi:PREDICTED: vesicle transport protein SFT2B isoform X1 [Brassica oleracea var. oleracea]|uniref:vesicle transport protein SFT2B isoform X1 n=1 Tax=Brassica oleracea var. oleracea TaxID=109376 RepID=UPI0006A6C851|nr:PREDICTED: vesicle transport protein SFT2B isoform X1 [Brassica oleracea var. oleracea]
MQKLNELFSGGGDGEGANDSFLEDGSEGLCSLSTTQRMYGFAASLAAGLLLMFLSMIVFAIPIKFALLFTFGNVLATGSTAFLMGPEQQINMMLDPVRIYATSIYGGCVLLALICALLIHSKILTVIAILCETCALICRYSLSYIPFARRMVSEIMIRLCDTEL